MPRRTSFSLSKIIGRNGTGLSRNESLSGPWNWIPQRRRAWRLLPVSGIHGPQDQAVEEARRLLQIDPLNSLSNGNLGSVFVFNRQWDRAIVQLRTAIDLDPNYWFDYNFLGRAYEQKGQLPEAIETNKRGLALEGNTELWVGLGHAYAVSGKNAEARKVVDHLQELSTQRYVAPYNVAVIYAGLGAGLGEKDDAFAGWNALTMNARTYLRST